MPRQFFQWKDYFYPWFFPSSLLLKGLKIHPLKTCLDIKQAKISGDSYVDYINEMGESINTVHLCDMRDDGVKCLPGKGDFPFEDLFKRLKDVNFKGNMLIEAYYEDYKEINELKDSLDYLRELKYKIF